MAIKNIIARGIGFSPGSVKFIPTLGFSGAVGWTPEDPAGGTWTPENVAPDGWAPEDSVSSTWSE